MLELNMQKLLVAYHHGLQINSWRVSSSIMAKLQIFNSKQGVSQSNTPRTSALALPLSLATQQGQDQAVTKAICDIKNDLLKIESQNAVDKAMKKLKIF